MSQQEEDEECAHRNASITVYEDGATVYTVEDSELDLGGEALKPDSTGEVSIECQDCGENWFFSSGEKIPEPWKTMVHRIFHELS